MHRCQNKPQSDLTVVRNEWIYHCNSICINNKNVISQVTKYCTVDHVWMCVCTRALLMDLAFFSIQARSRHALRWVCITMICEALKGLQTIALKFQWSNAEGIALSMKTKCYVICFQHLFSAMSHLYSPVISLPLSPIQATLHPKSLSQWTAL